MNTLLAQFDKVRRVRDQWKVILRGGTGLLRDDSGRRFGVAFARCEAYFVY